MAAVVTFLLVAVIAAAVTSVFHVTAEQLFIGATAQLVIWGFLFGRVD